ncbi:MAG TPA: regulatory iron-sulfur-containing complex subunit RicT [Gemmatimonadaceae bacterium]|nr:regulatory iron-sulfur-containing complex subunit RicT [Gemmatimonadaceae bacterium]
MPHLVEVAFKGNRKDFYLWDQDDLPALKTAVIVDADRGEDLGFVHAVGELAEKRNSGTPHGYGAAGTSKKIRRLATIDDVKRADELRTEDEDARRQAADRVRANALVMKLSDAEWQWDRKKLTLYFTAEKRVDFRALVRELASMFRTRIELKQIGVRDEAKRLDGIGRCGRQYCSASWLPELRPVNLGVAKDQRLSLNPSQISGACGRLMCCLRYEHEFYVQSRKRFPKEGRIVKTAKGDEKIIANDIFRDRVTLRGEDGELRTITLVELHEEAHGAGAPLPVPTAATAFAAHDTEDEELPVEDVVESVTVAVAEEPAVEASPEGATDGRERRPHRRRGRRGGRRNRSARGPRENGGTGEGGEGSEGGESDDNEGSDAGDDAGDDAAGDADDSPSDGGSGVT